MTNEDGDEGDGAPVQQAAMTVEGLSRNRRLVRQIVGLAENIPRYPVERLMQLGPLAEARRNCRVRVGWVAVFTKAYALVARDAPVLRSWYVSGLWPRVATAPHSVASIAVSRPLEGTISAGDDVSSPSINCPVRHLPELYFAQVRSPDSMPLSELQKRINRFSTDSVHDVFRRQRHLSMLPTWLARTVLGWNVRSASLKRATRFGTFSVSSLGAEQASNRFHPSFLTSSLTFSPLAIDGQCLVTLICDHRLIDGVPAARALAALERKLLGEIREELQQLA